MRNEILAAAERGDVDAIADGMLSAVAELYDDDLPDDVLAMLADVLGAEWEELALYA